MKIAYGSRFLELALPQDGRLEIVTPPPIQPSMHTLGAMIEKAFENPVDFPRLDKYLRDKSRILLVVPDTTRPCPLPKVLPLVIEHLQRFCFVSSLRIITANGTHKPAETASLRCHIGPQVFERWPVVQHDSNSQNITEVGRTSRGTRVALNRLLFDAEAIVAVGPIQHHYFAGFGGGPKLIMPGLAATRTTFQNHRLSIGENGHIHPNCREGILDGNPVAEDIFEAVSLCPPVLYLGLILDENWRVVECMAGDIVATQRALAQVYHRTHLRIVPERRPLVIASAGGMPRDCNLIQAHRGLHRAFRLVEPGGVLVYLAQCADGIGSTTFMPWFELATAAEMGKELAHRYTLNGQTALSLKEKTEKAEIIFVSDLLPEIVSRTGMKPMSPPENGMLDLNDLAESTPELRGWIFPKAAEFLPLTRDEMRPEDKSAIPASGVDIL
jgi:nickel-dependent lactate racemase